MRGSEGNPPGPPWQRAVGPGGHNTCLASYAWLVNGFDEQASPCHVGSPAQGESTTAAAHRQLNRCVLPGGAKYLPIILYYDTNLYTIGDPGRRSSLPGAHTLRDKSNEEPPVRG